jgi:hypothetical protein
MNIWVGCDVEWLYIAVQEISCMLLVTPLLDNAFKLDKLREWAQTIILIG